MTTRISQHSANGQPVGRRTFLGVAGASALSLKMGMLDFASSLFAGETRAAARPRVQVAFVRPEGDRYWMSWPGASYDVPARQAEYTQTLIGAAERLGVDLELRPLPLDEPDTVAAFTQQVNQSPPDGIVLCVMHLKAWPKVEYILRNRGAAPTVVFSPLGAGFAKQLRTVRGVPGTFVASAQDSSWLATGLRMVKTAYDLKRARLCIVAGNTVKEQQVKATGTTLRYLPLERWVQEVAKADTTDQMQAVAAYYAKEAQKIIEPRKEDILAAAKNYVVARRIMAAERCQGISVDCYPLLNERRIACGMCLAWSRLLDEGLVGTCEGDGDAAISQLLSAALLGRPGFMHDPAPNTLRNTVLASHCTCPTRLNGFDMPHEPFVLRSQAESASGVALQVFWQPDRPVTVMKFVAPDKLALARGQVLASVDGSASTACRTALEIKIDGLADVRDIRDHHQLLIAGKWEEPLRAYAELAGLKIVPVA